MTAAAPNGEAPVALDRQAQQLAANLHSQLSQANQTWPPASAARELQALSAANRQLASSLRSAGAQHSEEAEEAQAACSRREALLDGLLQLLDTSTQDLRAQLDSCHRLLQVKPCTQDAGSIIRYAHTLRNAFAPLGKAPGLPQVPPAPQLPFMLCSTLRAYNMELAKQQQQALALEQPGLGLLAEQQQAAGVAAQAPEQQLQQQQQQPSEHTQLAADAAAVQQQQQQQVVAPAIQLLLNEDLLEDELGSQVEEDFSEDDYSDD